MTKMQPKVSECGGSDNAPGNQNDEKETAGGVRYLGSTCAGHPGSMEQEKRIRREVANSNERRRMQSINAGFLALRAMLPQRDGEKLSKAAILQQTSDFIFGLEQEKARLLTQNCQLKRLLEPQSGGGGETAPASVSSACARLSISEEELEAPCDSAPPPPPPPLEPLRQELQELRGQLEQERRQRLAAEERLRRVEGSPSPQPQQQQHRVHMRFKKPRLDAPPISPQLVMTSAVESPPPPPLPPVANHRPMYMGSTTSRQNLDTIVEAIRHLEGDHLFGDIPEPRPARAQPAPPPPPPPPPPHACVGPVRTRLEPLQTRLEPLQTRLEAVQTHVEPPQTRLEPFHTQLEPQEAPLELTTHARFSSDSYRPGVIVAQHPPLRH